jgi:hypothetical protein
LFLRILSGPLAQAEDMKDRLLRTLADMENLRDRTARTTAETKQFAVQVGPPAGLGAGASRGRLHALFVPLVTGSSGVVPLCGKAGMQL